MLEKSHTATQLENKKQWQQLHLHDQALEQSIVNTARPSSGGIWSKAEQNKTRKQFEYKVNGFTRFSVLFAPLLAALPLGTSFERPTSIWLR